MSVGPREGSWNMHIPLLGSLTGASMANAGHQVFSFVDSKSFCHDQLLLQCQSTRTENMETQVLIPRSAAFDIEQTSSVGNAAMYRPCRQSRCHTKWSLIFRFHSKISNLPYVPRRCNIFGAENFTSVPMRTTLKPGRSFIRLTLLESKPYSARANCNLSI